MNGNAVTSNDFEDDSDENDVLVFHIMITDPLARLK